jgi:hypothetical protein
MTRIFVSYRREDSQFPTASICKTLARYFGEQSVFRDVDNIPAGSDFRSVLLQSVASSDAVIAVIGKDWLAPDAATGKARIHNPDDFVRVEIQAALDRNLPLIPVLLHPAKMPAHEELPQPIGELAFRQGVVIYPDPDFDSTSLKLVESLFRILPKIDRRGQKALASLQCARRGLGAIDESVREFSSGWKLTCAAAAVAVVTAVLGTIFLPPLWREKSSASAAPSSSGSPKGKDNVAAVWNAADRLRLEKQIALMRNRPLPPISERHERARTESSLGAPDLSCFDIVHDDFYWDLRGWKDLNHTPAARSYINLERQLRIAKIGPASEIRFQGRTDGEELFLRSLSHPAKSYEIVAESGTLIGGRTTKTRQLVIDVSDVPMLGEINLRNHSTYWGSMQDPKDRWIGAVGYPRSDRIRIYILMPDEHPLRSYRLEQAPISRDAPEPYTGPLRLLTSDDGMSVLWEIPTPQPNWAYTIVLDW